MKKLLLVLSTLVLAFVLSGCDKPIEEESIWNDNNFLVQLEKNATIDYVDDEYVEGILDMFIFDNTICMKDDYEIICMYSNENNTELIAIGISYDVDGACLEHLAYVTETEYYEIIFNGINSDSVVELEIDLDEIQQLLKSYTFEDMKEYLEYIEVTHE